MSYEAYVSSLIETAQKIDSGQTLAFIGPGGELITTLPSIYEQHPEWYAGCTPISGKEYLEWYKVPELVNPSPGVTVAPNPENPDETVVSVTYSPPLAKVTEGQKEILEAYGIPVKTLEEATPTQLVVSAPIQEVSPIVETAVRTTTVSQVAKALESLGEGTVPTVTVEKAVTTPAPAPAPAIPVETVLPLLALAAVFLVTRK
ncbi:MAG: hypothetical protein QXK12_08450 [Candidatus Nezhaarchaeales archaeon]